MEEKSLPASVGEKIAALRKERGLTQKQLAEKIYTSDKNLSKWETGKALPDLGFLLALCREFNVKTDYFTDENFSAADLFNAQRQKEIKRRFGVWTSVIAAIAGIPLFILAAARAYLPSPLPVHFNADLQADRMGDVRELSVGAMLLFFLTAAALITLIIYYVKRPNAQMFRSKRHIDAYFCVFLLVSLVSLATTLTSVISCHAAAQKQGLVPPDAEPFPIVMAAMLAFIYWIVASILMFVPRNDFFGFRIPSAFASDFNWRAFNLSSALVMMCTALAIALAMIYMPRPLDRAEALAGSLAPLLPALILSYLAGKIIILRRQRRDAALPADKQ